MTVFPQGTLIWQRFTNVSFLRTYYGKKGGTRLTFDRQRENLLGYDGICMVNLLGTPRVIVLFSFLLHDGLGLVVSEEKFCFVKGA